MTRSTADESRHRFEVIVLDFDGTIVQSNEVKGDCFRMLFNEYGVSVGDWAFKFHLSNPGIPRREKISNIVETFGLDGADTTVDQLCGKFSSMVVDQVLACPLVDGVVAFLEFASSRFPLYVSSAAPDSEVRDFLQQHALSGFFRGVFGSSISKTSALELIASEHEVDPRSVLFVGDSDADRSAAQATGVGFFRISEREVGCYSRLRLELEGRRREGVL